MILVLCIGTSTVTYSAKKLPSINKGNITVTVGKKTTIKISDTDKKIKWVVGNKKIAKIVKVSGTKSNKVTIKGLKKGTTKIYAKMGNKKLKCKIKVKAKKNSTVKPVKKITSSTVYITPSGSKYHSTVSCATLSRSKTIQSVYISSLSSKYKPCKVCH